MNFEQLVGEIVEHEEHGAGVITKIVKSGSAYIIDVRFEGKKDIVRYSFPDVFIKYKKLSTQSRIIQAVIDGIQGEYTCSLCGKRCKDNDAVFINNEPYCQICAKKFVECENCGCKFLPENAGIVMEPNDWREDTEYICKSCSTNYKKCTECGEWYNVPDVFYLYPKISENINLCEYCMADLCDECSGCGVFFLSDEMIEVDDELVCPSCRESATVICKSCGNLMLKVRDGKKTNGYCKKCDLMINYKNEVNQRVSNLNLENQRHMSFREFKSASSVPLMTRLVDGERLRVDPNESLYHDNPFEALIINMEPFNVAIMIVYEHSRNGILSRNCRFECTASELKKCPPSFWNDMNKDRRDESIDIDQTVVFDIWNKAYRIRAVTVYDQDYRKEWRNGELEYEGNNYGDTSDFYIIGAFRDRRFQ